MVKLPKGMDCREPRQAVVFQALSNQARDYWLIWLAVKSAIGEPVPALLRKQAG